MKRLGFRCDVDPVRAAELEVREAQRELRRRERGERRRFSADARRRRRIWLIAGAAVAGLALFVLVGVFTPAMGVREVEIVGASSANTDDLQKSLASFEGVPLALVNDRDVALALESYPLIQRYAVERIPPHTLRVRIVERVPVLAIEQGDEFRQYDAAGVLIGKTEKRVKGVPVAKGEVARTDSQAFEAAAQILRDIPAELRERITSARATGDQDVTLKLRGGPRVMWGSTEDTQRKALVLDAMLETLEGRQVKLIDVSSPSAPIFR